MSMSASAIPLEFATREKAEAARLQLIRAGDGKVTAGPTVPNGDGTYSVVIHTSEPAPPAIVPVAPAVVAPPAPQVLSSAPAPGMPAVLPHRFRAPAAAPYKLTVGLNTNPAYDPKVRPDISIELEYITGALAAEYLALNFEWNRRKKRGQIADMTATHAEGAWLVHHQGIAFDEMGRLIDGQNRLQALINSGVPGVWMFVARGVPRYSLPGMDVHKSRSPDDQLQVIRGERFTKKDVAICRAMVTGNRSDGANRRDVVGLGLMRHLVGHRDAIRFAGSAAASAPRVNSVIRGIVARAYYHEPHDKLVRFLVVLGDGESTTAAERTIIKFRDFVRGEGRGRGGAAQREMASKTVSALRGYLAGRAFNKSVGASLDPWPLPEVAIEDDYLLA